MKWANKRKPIFDKFKDFQQLLKDLNISKASLSYTFNNFAMNSKALKRSNLEKCNEAEQRTKRPWLGLGIISINRSVQVDWICSLNWKNKTKCFKLQSFFCKK